MKIKYLFLILIIIISCKKDKNLRDSIFIEDVESPGLPAIQRKTNSHWESTPYRDE